MDNPNTEQHDLEAIGNIAGSIANDFNNWLGIISGYALSITDNLIPKTRAHEDALRILEAARHAEALTKRLLSFSKASKLEESGTTKLLEVNHLIEETISLAKEALSEKNIQIKHQKSNPHLHIKVDYSQFIDCLMHIFFNAMEAMPNGGTINVNTAEKPLDGKDYAIIRVRDSGEGIPREDLTKIFDPFFSTRNARSSIGLGLTVVRNFVAQWGGSIKVRSQPGRGASFRIFVPKAEETTNLKKVSIQSKGGAILVIDDDHSTLTTITNCLSKEGYDTHALSNSSEAIEHYKSNSQKISLVIIDVVMPGKSGKKVLKSILDINPDAAIIMISGFSRDYIKNHLKMGRWGFVQKPIDKTSLLESVRDALRKEQKEALRR
jgi:two-component system cell cycle sensor histidine kinase/response regulator CckA